MPVSIRDLPRSFYADKRPRKLVKPMTIDGVVTFPEAKCPKCGRTWIYRGTCQSIRCSGCHSRFKL